TPVESAQALAALGFRIVIFPGGTARAVAHALQAYYGSLREHGTTAPWRDRMLDVDQLNAVIVTPALLHEAASSSQGLPRGSQRQNTAAAARPKPPMAATAAASDTRAVMADRTTGPRLLPRSDTSRQMPRNSVRAAGGAASAPSVMTMPEPMPLPMPSIM